jgi:hypothetical protein
MTLQAVDSHRRNEPRAAATSLAFSANSRLRRHTRRADDQERRFVAGEAANALRFTFAVWHVFVSCSTNCPSSLPLPAVSPIYRQCCRFQSYTRVCRARCLALPLATREDRSLCRWSISRANSSPDRNHSKRRSSRTSPASVEPPSRALPSPHSQIAAAVSWSAYHGPVANG